MEVGSVFASLCIWRWACPSVILGSAPVSSKSEKWTLGEIKVATKISILSHENFYICLKDGEGKICRFEKCKLIHSQK